MSSPTVTIAPNAIILTDVLDSLREQYDIEMLPTERVNAMATTLGLTADMSRSAVIERLSESMA